MVFNSAGLSLPAPGMSRSMMNLGMISLLQKRPQRVGSVPPMRLPRLETGMKLF
jgi:hypothetical protein